MPRVHTAPNRTGPTLRRHGEDGNYPSPIVPCIRPHELRPIVWEYAPTTSALMLRHVGAAGTCPTSIPDAGPTIIPPSYIPVRTIHCRNHPSRFDCFNWRQKSVHPGGLPVRIRPLLVPNPVHGASICSSTVISILLNRTLRISRSG